MVRNFFFGGGVIITALPIKIIGGSGCNIVESEDRNDKGIGITRCYGPCIFRE